MNLKVLIVTVSLCITAIPIFSASVVKDNIKYKTMKGQEAVSCSADRANELTVVEIPSMVSINGIVYPVKKIEAQGFKKCKNLKSIVIPSTVTTIGKEAFWDCSALESVILPDKCQSKISDGTYGFGKVGIFHGCNSLKRIRGTTMLYPRYMVYDALYGCEDVPAYASVRLLDPKDIDKVGSFNKKFSSFAKDNYLNSVEQWQRRKSYETQAQWETRVNEQNRRKMIGESAVEARAEFLRLFAPVAVKGYLEDYDSINKIFPINMGEMGMVYASVEQADAEFFAENWKDAKVIPEFGIIEDEVGIVSCVYEVGHRTFSSPRTYMEDDLDELALQITPIATLREYELQQQARETKSMEKKVYAPDEVDVNIPLTSTVRGRTFAVIIGNENYQRVAKVDFAQNDARVLSKYFTRTLGIPESNVRTYYDASYGDIIAAIEDLKSISEAYKGDIDVIFYYAGHGIPDESNRDAFILPVDAQGSNTESCYPLRRLYEELDALQSRSTVVLLDACFSGSLRGDGMLASARGIKMRPKQLKAPGNLIILSAASGDQTAFPYEQKNHGLFSYFLIKKLNESEGDVTLGQLSEYIIENVSQKAITEIKKPQTPTVKSGLGDEWRMLKF